MSKKRAIRRFIFLSIVVAIGIFLAVANFDIPFSYYHYNGFAGAIPLGLDLEGGLSVVYDCHSSGQTSLASGVDATITRLQDLLYSEGYSEANVTKQGSSKIRVEVPGVNDTGEIFEFLEDPKMLYMTEEQATEGKTVEAMIDGHDISDVYVSYNSEESKYGVVLRFTSEGSDKFAKLTTLESGESEKSIYIYFGAIDAQHYWSTLTCEEQITGGSTFISGGDINDYDKAKEYALNIMSGTFDVELELLEKSNISASLGQNALLYGIIAGAVALVIVMGLMWWRYGDFGLLADFALVIYLVLMMFFLQAIPFVQLTLPGIAGIILSLGMAVDGNIIIFERIKEEYAAGKKMHLAVKGGFKRAFWPIFDSNITTIFTSIILYILGSASIKGFAITLLIGIVLSMFTTLVVTRFLTKTYLGINTTKPSHARLYREAGVVEISEEPEKPETEIVVTGGDTNE